MSTISSENGNRAASKGFKISKESMDDGRCILGALIATRKGFKKAKSLRTMVDAN